MAAIRTSKPTPAGKPKGKKETAPFPRKIEQFSYMSIDFGNSRRLTTAFSGEKASGAVPMTVWHTWLVLFSEGGPTTEKVTKAGEKLTESQRTFLLGPALACKNVGERVDCFIQHVNALWPEWNVPPKAFTVGEPVSYDFGPRRGGKDDGEITKVAGSKVVVKFKRMGNLRMAADMLG